MRRVRGASATVLGVAVSPESAPESPNVEIRRSRRRRRTVNAYRDGGKTVVLMPAGLQPEVERHWVELMLQRLETRERRQRQVPGDQHLLAHAHELSRRYLDGRAEPASVRWVGNQHKRWGSCTPQDRSIRLSDRLRGMPTWVVDYVIVHELVHLLVPGHGPDFWELVGRYPKTERARGYLEGVAATASLPLTDTADADDPDSAAGSSDMPEAPAGAPETAAGETQPAGEAESHG